MLKGKPETDLNKLQDLAEPGHDIQGNVANAEQKPAKKDYKIKVGPSFFNYSSHSLAWRIGQVLLGSFLAALAMDLFIENAGLLPAGFVGLSKLLQRILARRFGLDVPYFVINVFFNLAPAIYAYFHVGKKFVLLSLFSVVVSSALTDLIPVFHLTDDMFLSAVMAAVIYGIGMILIVNVDASCGGTDFIAMAISAKKKVAIWNYVMIFNFVILTVSAMFFSLEAALYSIVFQFISTQILSHGHLRYQRKTCFIVTESVQPLADELMRLTKHGITVFDAKGCYSGRKQYVLYMVVGRRDVRLIRHYLRENAPNTFLNVTDSEQLGGNFFVEPMD